MGLRCIIGHDYGDPETSEEREERGNERVVTVEEYRECRRCGHRKIMSENTEVRTIQQSSSEPEPSGPDAGRPDPTPAASATEPAESSEFEDTTAEEDDGVILEDDSTSSERSHGEWPERDDDEDEEAETEAEGADTESDDHWPDDHAEQRDAEGAETETEITDWPEHEAEDEGIDAEPGSAGPADVDFGGGLTPEPAADEGTGDGDEFQAGDVDTDESGDTVDDAAIATEESGATATASGIQRADTSPTPTAQQRSASPDATFECPQCGFTSPAQATSLRTGDICPECQRGYLTEQAD